jgi:hypothetical protein
VSEAGRLPVGVRRCCCGKRGSVESDGERLTQEWFSAWRGGEAGSGRAGRNDDAGHRLRVRDDRAELRRLDRPEVRSALSSARWVRARW